ncbi:hypothetical protein DICPUDRAFT_83880 [Dictyostelium purpureum]|uniref:Letm1 RBD domain-containing protein n=1 Tax=Dictyostelium purpureum TaxID=5786 RepID=F1A0X1_DICPU|nr:uncharacterized protein DICPUDRAFT_83880 [Dictyostelium purpureum]EGC30155.1 hypothetical protein DICPUDRAFT_83880 [Dictyostelium purpureum]|eukprot:XP_003293317.1 hypothetical protein DICPUDRAFT_83880 [Dictyostelium purpureum]
MIVNKNIIKNLYRYNYSTIRKFSTSNNNINITKNNNTESNNTVDPPTTNYCHNYFSNVQNYKSYDDNVNLIKNIDGTNEQQRKETSSSISSQFDKNDYSGIFGPIKKQMAYLTKVVENGIITFRNDRIYYKNNLLPKASILKESLYTKVFPTFQYHNQDSYHYLNFHERKDIIAYRTDRLTFIPLAIFLSIPFSTFGLPFYIKFLPGLLPRGFSERSQVVARHDKMMRLREHYSSKLLHKYELEEKVEKLFGSVKSISDISPLKIKELDDEFILDFSEIKRKRLRTICRSLGETTLLNSNQLLKDKVLGFGPYISKESDQIIKEINSLTFEDFQDLLYERSLSFTGLNYYEMKEKFMKYAQLLKSLEALETVSGDLQKEGALYKRFYKRFILLNAIIIKYKL